MACSPDSSSGASHRGLVATALLAASGTASSSTCAQDQACMASAQRARARAAAGGAGCLGPALAPAAATWQHRTFARLKSPTLACQSPSIRMLGDCRGQGQQARLALVPEAPHGNCPRRHTQAPACLQVAVKHRRLAAVQVQHAGGRLRQNRQPPAPGQCSCGAAVAPSHRQHVGQRPVAAIFGDNGWRAGTHSQELHAARVPQRGQCRCFLPGGGQSARHTVAATAAAATPRPAYNA